MTKPVIIGIVVSAAVVLGGGYALMSNNSDDNGGEQANQTSQTSESTTQTEQAEIAASEASFASVSSSGKAQKCNFNYSGSEGSGVGAVYSDGKGRGLMTIKVTSDKGTTSEINTLVTEDKAYTWFTNDGGKALGFVFDKSSFENRTSSNTTSSTGGTDPNKKFTMDCTDWTLEESMLTPPSNVNFSTLPAAS